MKAGDVVDGKYELVRLIGEGGMGSVFEARHLEIGRRAALKFLHPQVSSSPVMVTRFIREAQAAASIGSEHIVDVTDVGRLPDGCPYLVMEYLEGEDLSTIGRREKRLDPQRAVSYCVQVCEALSQAHVRGIIHRDIKPQNIFVTRRAGRSGWIKVLDFGIAKFRAELTGESKGLTGPGISLGTPQYMATEQFTGKREVDGRADVYSVGVVLYILLTGKLPFTGGTHEEIIVQIATGSFEPPRALRLELDQSLSEIVVKALARKPDDRFQTIDELARALLPFADSDCDYSPAPPRRTNERNAPGVARRTTAAGDAVDRERTQSDSTAGHGGEGRDEDSCPTAAELEDFLPTAAELEESVPTAAALERAEPVPTRAEPLIARTPTSWQVEEAPPARKETGSSISRFVFGGIVLLLALGAGAILMNGFGEGHPEARVSRVSETAAAEPPSSAVPVRSEETAEVTSNRWVPVTPALAGTVLGLSREMAKRGITGFRPDRGITAPVYPYEIQQHEVTWEELGPWLRERSAREIAPPDSLPEGQSHRYPATAVPWATALEYCRSLGGALPTEEEWEYAARGSELRPYPWGTSTIDLARTHIARAGHHMSPVMTNDQDVTPGDRTRAVYDLLGNAREWTASLYRLDTPAMPEEEAWTQDGGRTFRAVRGLPPNESTASELPRVGLAHRIALCATGPCTSNPEEEEQYRRALRNIGFRCARRAGND